MFCFHQLNNQSTQYLTCFYNILEQMKFGMTNAQLTQSISHNFIVQMIPHHLAAIEMSKNVLLYTTCRPLQQIANHIIVSQTNSISNMQSILDHCEAHCNTAEELQLYQRRINLVINRMFSLMGGAPETNQISKNFMKEMIPHHEGAIEMSKNALKYDICPELIPILCSIISSQQKGVQEMQALLRCDF